MRRILAAVLLSLAAVAAVAGTGGEEQSTHRNTSDQGGLSANPSVSDIVNNGCAAGSALVGVTIDRVSGKTATMRPRCRPLPTNSGGWCGPNPPSNVPCSCDGYEKLVWSRPNINGCWMCVANGQACQQPTQCACVRQQKGSWVPMSCKPQLTVSRAADLTGFDASADSCMAASDTGCTYRAVPGGTCP